MNVANRKFYGGVNPILLEIAAETLGCSSPWWGTLKEWESVGGKVRPDSLGARIPHWQEAVYNLEQTDRGYEPPAPVYDDPAPVFDAIVRGAAITIEYAFSAECKYFGAEDKIRMPHRWLFEIGPGGVSGYFDAKGHEIGHWSESRMHWDASPDVCELRTEILSGYLCALLGVKPLPRHLARHHDSHAARWSRLMRSDPTLLVKVCENVTATVTWLLAFAGKQVDWCGPARQQG